MLVEPPEFTSCVICLGTDVSTPGLVTLGGAFVHLGFHSFPTSPIELFLYTELIGGRGEVCMHWRLLHASESVAPLLEWDTRGKHAGPLVLDNRVWILPTVSFPTPGEYLVQAWWFKAEEFDRRAVPREPLLIKKHFRLVVAE